MRDLGIILFLVAVVAVGWYVFFGSRPPEAPVPAGPAAEPQPQKPAAQATTFTTAEKFQRSEAAARLLGQAEEAQRAGDRGRARELLRRAAAYQDTWPGQEARRRLAKPSAPAASPATGAPEPPPAPAKPIVEEPPSRPDEPYTVQPGDTLTSIARRLGTTVEQIKLANRKQDDLLRAGERLLISWRKPAIVVDKESLKLYFLYGGQVLRSYLVGIGRSDSASGLSATPEGDFEIATKIKNPPWYRRGERIEYGDPRNILGTRWMGFKPTAELQGYGIHGTTQPETIPGRYSNGCVRMLNRNVEEIFEWTPRGTRVYIRTRWQPTRPGGAGAG